MSQYNLHQDAAPLRLAVIGAGRPNIATSNHLPAIAKLRNVELVALCDIDEEGVRSQATKWGVRWYTDYEKLLADSEIEAVVICTPDWLHCEQTVLAAQAGKHILCEKPMGLSLEEADRMVNAVRQANVVFMPGHQTRFSKRYQKFREIIESGRIGDPVYGRVAVKGAFFPYPQGSPYYKKFTGGQFVHNGPHIVDSLFYLMGQSDVTDIYTQTRSVYPNEQDRLETDNYTSVMLKFADGATASLEQNLTMLAPRGYPMKEQIMIIGTLGTLAWDTLDEATIFNYSGGRVNLTDANHIGGHEDPYAAEIEYFAQCIRSGVEPAMNVEFSRNLLKVCLAPQMGLCSA